MVFGGLIWKGGLLKFGILEFILSLLEFVGSSFFASCLGFLRRKVCGIFWFQWDFRKGDI